MSELLELQHKLQDTSATIAQLERALAADPNSAILRLNLESVVTRFGRLEVDFHSLANRHALDVCSYRLFASTDQEPNLSLRGYSGALSGFQVAISALFDALKNGRRLRSRFSPDVTEATRLGFGYAFGGSVGVVLTMERERLLFGGGMLEDAITTFFSVAQAPTHEDIRAIGQRLGPAPLRAIFNWAKAHVEDGLGADIVWRQGGEVTAKLFLEYQELERLRAAIAATSEESTETVETAGLLTGAVMRSRRFTFEPDGGDEVTGTFTDAINEAHTVTLPTRYRVRLEKLTKIQYSSEQEQITWHLLSLGAP